MAKTIKDVLCEITKLNGTIKQTLDYTDYSNSDDLSSIDIDRSDAEQLFLSAESRTILDLLAHVSHSIDYLNRPIKETGVLHKNSNDRYELNGRELTSGCKIEYLTTDDYHCSHNAAGELISVPYWASGTIEHNGRNYYITGDSKKELEGLKVRIR